MANIKKHFENGMYFVIPLPKISWQSEFICLYTLYVYTLYTIYKYIIWYYIPMANT
jgi:hypothetical protein